MSVRIINNTLEVFNPATGEDITSLPMSSLSELDSIFNTAEKAAESYNYSSFYRRQKLMTQFRKGIARRMDEFIEAICSETGKKPAYIPPKMFFPANDYASSLVWSCLSNK